MNDVEPVITITIGVAVFVASAFIDFANTRYVQAVGRNETHTAARWSVLQWGASLVGFVVAMKVTLWMLPVEMLGLYAGTYLSMSGPRKRRQVPGG